MSYRKDDASPKAIYLRDWRVNTEGGKAYAENRKQYMKDYQAEHQDHIDAVQKENRRKTRLEALQHYSGKEVPECACCGENIFEFLNLDHVNGDGAAHRREIGMVHGTGKQNHQPKIGGNGFPRWLKRNGWPNDPPIQVLCCNCDAAKRHNSVCPHQRARDAANNV